jgi:uncharacterized membrane protein
MANPPDQPPVVSTKKTAVLCYWLCALLLAVAIALEIAAFFFPLNFSAWFDPIFVFAATASTLVSLWRRLPMQNVLLAALGVAVIGGGFSALGARTGLPFGQFLFASHIGPILFKTLPAMLPLVWIVIILSSRGVARLILRPWRKTRAYGFRVIGLTAFLVLLFVFTFDPFASRVRHYWLWLPTTLPLTWQGASLINFVSWGFIAVLILLLITPVLIVKKPRSKSAPDFQPLCLWLGAVLVFGTGCALNHLWAAAIADAVIGIGTAVFAIRGALW